MKSELTKVNREFVPNCGTRSELTKVNREFVPPGMSISGGARSAVGQSG